VIRHKGSSGYSCPFAPPFADEFPRYRHWPPQRNLPTACWEIDAETVPHTGRQRRSTLVWTSCADEYGK
jgi:hypothetical protein